MMMKSIENSKENFESISNMSLSESEIALQVRVKTKRDRITVTLRNLSRDFYFNFHPK